MADSTTSALIGAASAAVTLLLKEVIDLVRERLNQSRERTIEINREYLNPLRLQLAECYFRLREILDRVHAGGGQCPPLLVLEKPEDVVRKPPEWFNGEGCYLISCCYLHACLFYHLLKAREGLTYVKFRDDDDTILVGKIIKVHIGFLRNLGVFYVTQPSIGADMYSAERSRLLTYREFSELLSQDRYRPWFDRLLFYFIDTGRGQNLDRVREALAAMQELGTYLDRITGGDFSLLARLDAEGVKGL